MRLLHVIGALAGLSLLAASSSREGHCVWLSSDLIGMKVVSQEGDSLGKIEDVVLHPGGEASYAVLSFGGWLGMGDKLFAMPWTVLRTIEADTAKKDSARSLVLKLDKERLKTAPGFDKKNWPTTANPNWARDVDAFYSGDVNPNTKRPVDAAARTSVITWKATELEGADVKTPTGEQIGEIEEVAIDSNGRVSYVALSVGDYLGTDERMIAVPWDSLKFPLGGEKSDKKLITLASTKEQLENAPEFKEGKENCREMCDWKWVSRVYDHFSCPRYWDATRSPDIKQSSK